MKEEKNKIIINFKKARSHTDKIIKMMEEGQYCVDIMQQGLAVIGLLKSAHHMLLEEHLKSCFRNAMTKGDKKTQQMMIEEVLNLSKMVNR